MLRSLSFGMATASFAFASILTAQSATQRAQPAENVIDRTIDAVQANPARTTFRKGEILLRFRDGAGQDSVEALSIETESALTRMRSNETLGVHQRLCFGRNELATSNMQFACVGFHLTRLGNRSAEVPITNQL